MFDDFRLKRQVEFIVEIDKLKQVCRQSYISSKKRQETSAEHSWHIALMAILLSEYAISPKIDVFRVVKMLLIHDLVEIDAGDTFCYDSVGRVDQHEREEKAAKRIFSLLPMDQTQKLKSLWDEFEACQTLNSQFANAIDRLHPIISNYYTDGKAWLKHDVTRDQVVERNIKIEEGAPKLWCYVLNLIEEAVQQGILKENSSKSL